MRSKTHFNGFILSLRNFAINDKFVNMQCVFPSHDSQDPKSLVDFTFLDSSHKILGGTPLVNGAKFRMEIIIYNIATCKDLED